MGPCTATRREVVTKLEGIYGCKVQFPDYRRFRAFRQRVSAVAHPTSIFLF